MKHETPRLIPIEPEDLSEAQQELLDKQAMRGRVPTTRAPSS